MMDRNIFYSNENQESNFEILKVDSDPEIWNT